MPVAKTNLRWARTLMKTFAANGIEQAVISPGSRSTPLVLACVKTPGIAVRVQPDERTAAFFALGLAKGSGRPVVLICTSGSAPAHWYPAVIEARMAGIPLLLLTADRPPELQDCGANQAIDQNRLFGVHVNAFHAVPVPDAAVLETLPGIAARAVTEALAPRPGPVHLNLPFREPLVPTEDAGTEPLPPARVPSHPHRYDPTSEAAELAETLGGRRGVILCGAEPQSPGYGHAVSDLAAALRVPVVADPLSGLRFGVHDRSHVLARADALFRMSQDRFDPEWVLSFGGAPVSKAVLAWLEGCHAPDVVVVDANGRRLDPAHRATRLMAADPVRLALALKEEDPDPAPSDWLDGFLAAERAAAVDTRDIPEARVVETIIRVLPDGATLFAGNSLPVREIDWFSGIGGTAINLMANRGTSGIDGSLSTVLGIAATTEAPVVGLIGDLAFFHDMTGLLAAREHGLSATLVVLENGGGGIFEYLPQAELPTFSEHWLTPVGIEIGQAAALFGVPHRRVPPNGEFEDALTESVARPGVDLIEVTIDRMTSVAAHRAWWTAVAQTLGGPAA